MTIPAETLAFEPDPDTIIPKLRTLNRNQQLIYHVGLLAADRSAHVSDMPRRRERARSIHLIGGTAMDLSDEGKVALFQRKRAPFVYEYIAVGI